MDVPTPDVKKGPPTPGEQLPQGAAQQVQESTAQAQQLDAQVQQATTPQLPQQGAPQGAPAEGVQAPQIQKTPRDGSPGGQLGNEEDNILFGPTDRPDENVSTGASVLSNTRATLPKDADKWLPALRIAAQDPSAPPMFKQMMQILLYKMNQGT